MKGSTAIVSLMLCTALATGDAGAAGNTDTTAREQAARDATRAFLGELGATLKDHMQRGGPARAIDVCRDVAPELAGDISRQNGWQVTRVGTRVRNPLLGMPDVWEQKVLVQFKARAAKGEPLQGMRFSEVVREPQGRYFRYMQAIGVQPLCLTCHGAPEQIPGPVKAVLESDYPMDRATGYGVGELRGAVSIKQPLDLPLRASD
ncbi:MAG TPA: DUF3365 domain-containing protein [Gammaproteobacteria bacterium]|nr:DUF3365 domain-containing protein [Gammaproteobacteria bacterium]